jgi:hypothetical protein
VQSSLTVSKRRAATKLQLQRSTGRGTGDVPARRKTGGGVLTRWGKEGRCCGGELRVVGFKEKRRGMKAE